MSATEHPRQPRVGRMRVGVTFTVLAVIVLSTLAASPTYSLFSGTTTNTGSTFGSAASFPTYPASVTGDSAWSYHRQEESPSSAATLAAADSSGNARTGTYNGITNGPATFWKFEENTGSTTADSSGAANTGTLANTPTWTTGNTGNALSFNGTTQYVNGARAAVDTSTSFSVSAWVYLTSKAAYYTVASQDGTNISGFFLQYVPGGTDKFAFTVRRSDSIGSGSDIAYGPAGPSLNTWYHLVGVHDSVAQNIKLYVNGALQATTAHTTANAWNATGVFAVGRGKYNGVNADFWPGRADEVRAFRRALTANEILSLGSGLPVLDWEFSEGAGSTITSRGTSAYPGQFVGGGWTAFGHDGNGVVVDGVDDRVTGLNGAVAVATNTSYSVSAWVYLTAKNASANSTAVCENGTNVCAFWLQHDYGNDRWSFVVNSADNTGATVYRALGTASPSLNTWYHLVGVYDSSAGNIKLYVNGALQNTTAGVSTWNATSVIRAGCGFWSSGQNEFLAGRIDGVKAWQRALSATEITDLYNGAAYTEADMSAGLTGALQGAQQGLQSTTAVAYAGYGNGYTGTSLNNPSTFTVEAWFRTTSTTGGMIMSFGGQQTGTSSNRDRMVYLDSGNKLTFGVNPSGAKNTVRSTSTYNDGAWHHVAASLGAAGMKLYVDGDLVASDAAVTSAQNFTGYWRWGGDSISNWSNAPTTNYFTGTLDEIAIYTSQLTDQQIARHYAANH